MTRIVVYVLRRGSGAVETFTVEGAEAERLLERLERLAQEGLVKRGRLSMVPLF